MNRLCLALLLSTSSLACATPKCPPPNPTAPEACTKGRSFVVVRHAEKATKDKDTPLSDRGRARAAALATMLANAGVTRVIATEYKRTQETSAPLATKLGKPVETARADKTEDLLRDLRAAPDGSTTFVATHSNVVPLIVQALSPAAKLRDISGDALPEDDFARVYLITQPCGAVSPAVTELSSDSAP